MDLSPSRQHWRRDTEVVDSFPHARHDNIPQIGPCQFLCFFRALLVILPMAATVIGCSTSRQIRRYLFLLLGHVINMLTIPHLEALVAIAELGSFRAASQRLNVTQPTISLRIKQLEESLRVNLFDRSSYRPRLTGEGKAVLDLARRTLELTREMNAFGRRGQRVEGKIRLGVCDTFAITCLPALLSQLEQRTPGIEVALDIDYSANLDKGLREERIDIAFLTSPAPGDSVAFEHIADIEL